MGLYESIKENIGREMKDFSMRLAKQNPVLGIVVAVTGMDEYAKTWEGAAEQAYLILDATVDLGSEGELTEETIDNILPKYMAVASDPNVVQPDRDLVRNFIRLRVPFFQKLLSAEAETYDGAVREVFGDEETYRAALEELDRASEAVADDVMMKNPIGLLFADSFDKVKKEIQEKGIRRIFS